MRGALIGLVLMLASGSAAAQGGELAASGSPLDMRASGLTAAGPEDLVALGDLYVEAMRLPEASSQYKAALKLQKKYGEAEFGQARIDMAKGKLEKSKNACRGVWRRHKADSVGDVCAGWVWLTFDRSARAIDEFNKAIEKGDLARGKTGLGEAYRRQADHGLAISAYNEALAAGAGYLARMGLGLSQEANGDKAGALASLKSAVELEPASCMAHFHYGRLLGQGAEAADHLRTAIAIRPMWADGYQQLGEILLASGDYAGAQQAFNSAIESSKAPRGVAHYGLAQALYGQGKPAEAKTALEKAIELVPNLVDAYLLLSDIVYASGDTDGAIAALEQAKSVAPGEVKVFLHTGQTYFKLGRYTTANSYLNQAITMKAGLSIAYVLLGDISCERRLYVEGQAQYADALKGDMQGVTAAEIEQRKAKCKTKF
jgi:tetratricopeptide (TPR) repeat protein